MGGSLQLTSDLSDSISRDHLVMGLSSKHRVRVEGDLPSPASKLWKHF